ncbi:MAG: secretin N-terminal domain-containing protein [Thermoguttaceae bacterium]|jgi:Ca2+-binding EF-hand superfamily protein
MHRLILCLLTGLTVVFLPQYLLAEDPAGPPEPSKAQPAELNPEALFNRLDANHDGFITRDELPPGMPEMFKQLLFLADANGDGKITKEELTAALNQHRQSPDHDVKADSQLTIMSLRYANAAETAKIIDHVFSNQKDKKFSITVDARLNALIVSAPQTLSDKIEALVKELDVKTPDSNSPPIGPRFRGPEGQSGQIPGPPFGRGFGRSEGQPGGMAGSLYGRQGMGPGWMGGPPFGGRFAELGVRSQYRSGPNFQGQQGPGEEPPQKQAGADGPEGPVQVEVYSVTKADPQTALKVLQTLLAGWPDVRMDIDPKTNNLIVLARPAEHATIRAVLDQMEHDARQVVVIRLKIVDPQTAIILINKLFDGGDASKGGASGAPQVDADPSTRQLMIRGTLAQIEQIKSLLQKMGETEAIESVTTMPGPPFGGPGGGRGLMGGQGFGGPGRGLGWMAGQGFGGPGMGYGWMEGQGFGGPGREPAGMGGSPFGRGGPDGRPPQMAGRNFPGPNAGPPWMRGSHFNGPEQRPWAGPGYGPPHRWAAFESMQQRPWQQYGHWGPPNRPWQQYGHWGPPNRPWQANFGGPNHPWVAPWMAPGMAYGAGPRRPWPPNGQNWYQQLLSYNARLPRQGFNLKTLFDRLDTNHDNQLSFEEFSKGLKHLLHAVLHRPGPQWARPVGWFGGQGFGPPAHLDMANYPGSRHEVIRERITRLFEKFDKNHDGKLTKDEAPPKIQKNFDRIDADKKGFITPRDLYRAISLLRHRSEAQKPINQGAEKPPEKPQVKDKSE